MRPHGRASVSSRNPRAFAICDRCGFLYNHSQLQWQFDYTGAGLINKRILVCSPCLDTPQNQLRAIVLPSDPTPINNPRVQDYVAAETDYVTINQPTVTDFWTGIPIPSTTTLVTDDGQNVTSQDVGNPVGLDQNAVMTQFLNSPYRVNLNPTSVISVGTNIITVNCSTAHGLSTGAQVAIEGLSDNQADGFYTITVTTGVAFTYQTNSVINAGNLLQGTTLIVTALVGLPYNYGQIPLTGPV